MHSVWRRDTVLTGGVWDTFLAVPLLLDRPRAQVAMLGNAGGTVARAFGEFWPDVEIDGVEIDPAVTDVGYRFFGLGDNPRLDRPRRGRAAVPAPHRRALRPRLRRRVPPAVRAVLPRDAGVLPARARAARARRARRAQRRDGAGRPAAGRRLAGTLAHVFPEVRIWPVLRFNHIVIGFDVRAPRRARRAATRPASSRPLRELLLAPAASRSSGGRPVDGRPRAGRVGDRPDDRRVRGARRRPRRGALPDRAVIELLRGDGPLIRIGHRGAAALAPENTLPRSSARSRAAWT